MPDVRRMKAIVEAALKRIDPAAIAGGNFYDDASGRLFVTIFKGPRKISVALRERDFSDGNAERVNRAIEAGISRLAQSPIG